MGGIALKKLDLLNVEILLELESARRRIKGLVSATEYQKIFIHIIIKTVQCRVRYKTTAIWLKYVMKYNTSKCPVK